MELASARHANHLDQQLDVQVSISRCTIIDLKKG